MLMNPRAHVRDFHIALIGFNAVARFELPRCLIINGTWTTSAILLAK